MRREEDFGMQTTTHYGRLSQEASERRRVGCAWCQQPSCIACTPMLPPVPHGFSHQSPGVIANSRHIEMDDAFRRVWLRPSSCLCMECMRWQGERSLWRTLRTALAPPRSLGTTGRPRRRFPMGAAVSEAAAAAAAGGPHARRSAAAPAAITARPGEGPGRRPGRHLGHRAAWRSTTGCGFAAQHRTRRLPVPQHETHGCEGREERCKRRRQGLRMRLYDGGMKRGSSQPTQMLTAT
eukprot:364615-Chlamydomonas_euryale.AAC.25